MDRLDSAYEQKLRGRMEEARAEIDRLSARVKQLDADVQIESQEKMKMVKDRWQKLEEQLERMQKSGKEAGQEIREGIELAWDDLASSLKAAKRRLQPKSRM